MKHCLAIARSLALPTAWLGSAGAIAQQPQPEKVTALFKETMVEWPGKEVSSFLVEFPPGRRVRVAYPSRSDTRICARALGPCNLRVDRRLRCATVSSRMNTPITSTSNASVSAAMF